MKEFGKVSLLILGVVITLFLVINVQSSAVMSVDAKGSFVTLSFSDGRQMDISYSTFLEQLEDNTPRKFLPIEWDDKVRKIYFGNAEYVGYWAAYGGCNGIEIYEISEHTSVRCLEYRGMSFLLR